MGIATLDIHASALSPLVVGQSKVSIGSFQEGQGRTRGGSTTAVPYEVDTVVRVCNNIVRYKYTTKDSDNIRTLHEHIDSASNHTDDQSRNTIRYFSIDGFDGYQPGQTYVKAYG